MAVDAKLVFIRPADGSGRLVFDDASDVAAQPTEIGIDGTFSGDLDGQVQLLWSANVSRGEAVKLTQSWQSAQPAGDRSSTGWQDSRGVAVICKTGWQSGSATLGGAETRWQDSQRYTGRTGTRWQAGLPTRHDAIAQWQESDRLRSSAAEHWQSGDAQRAIFLAVYEEAIRMRTVAGLHWQDGSPRRALMRHQSAAGLPARIGMATRWQDARRPPAGLSVVTAPVDPEQEPCYDLQTAGRLEFLDTWAADGRLVFVCNRGGGVPVMPAAPLYILPARFYMAVHSLQAWRLPDMLPVPVLEFSFRAERGSFGWSFDVLLRRSAFDDLAPVGGVPARLRVEFDGLRFDMVVDTLGYDEAHESRGAKATCSSLTSLISGDNAVESQRMNSAQASAQQLALQALDLTGFSLDWGLTDWVVPAGAWSHSGTPLSAVQRIAEAAGGYLQSHRYLPRLMALHPYPGTIGGAAGGPWNWGSATVVPDVELAPSALVTIGVSRSNGPDLNGVYVSGVSQGVNGLYKRAGSAGDKLAGLITDPLATSIDVVRQRGRAVIGAAGPKQRILATLPILTGTNQPGVIDVGKLIQVNAAQPWRAMVRGVSGSVKFGREVRQTLDIERHLGA